VDVIRAMLSEQNVNILLLFLWLLPVVQLVTGILKSLRKGPDGRPQFNWALLDAFIYTDFAKRQLLLTIGLLLGVLVDKVAGESVQIPLTDLGAITATVSAFTLVYLGHVVASIIDNINPQTPDIPPTAV
jgi:hypothetical protein